MRPLFESDRPPALPVPSGVAFCSPLFREACAREIVRADPAARVAAEPLSEALPEALALTSVRPAADMGRDLARDATFTRHVQPLETVEEVRDLEAITLALGRARRDLGPARVDLIGLPRALRRRVLRESGPAPISSAPPLASSDPAPFSSAALPLASASAAPLLSALVLHGRLYLGASPLDAAMSPWAGGDPCFPAERISRAEWKLREALLRLEAPLARGLSALDIGAAPGGFTAVLLESGARVLAIDPAPLDARLDGVPGLRFLRAFAEHVPLEEVPPLDLITCDAVLSPAEIAPTIRRFASRLAPGGRAIVSLKLRPQPSPEEQLRDTAALFAPELSLVRTRHLHANRCEVTAFLTTAFRAAPSRPARSSPGPAAGASSSAP